MAEVTTQSVMERMSRTYEVWHKVVPTFHRDDSVLACLALQVLSGFPNGFEHVADVELPGMKVTEEVKLERVFELTNTIDRRWWENVGVTLTPAHAARGGARSTSIGDVIVAALPCQDAHGAPTWKRWLVEDVGFRIF